VNTAIWTGGDESSEDDDDEDDDEDDDVLAASVVDTRSLTSVSMSMSYSCWSNRGESLRSYDEDDDEDDEDDDEDEDEDAPNSDAGACLSMRGGSAMLPSTPAGLATGLRLSLCARTFFLVLALGASGWRRLSHTHAHKDTA
jgi:hypothetical protein